MQEIFYSGKIITNNENNDVLSSLMINDGSIFFVGEKDEILNLKTEDTKVNDLKDSYVYPTLFDVNANIFNKIDNKFKNANKNKKTQKSDEINEDYDNFYNFDDYKKEYLKLEKEYIKNGITTVFEINIDKRCFAFYKKMSEDKLLNIDVVGYVNLLESKQVMDDNCVTYRKYRNRFRLGGYYLKIDGLIQDLKAWLSKPYSGTKSYHASGEAYGEHLYYLLKTALEEKKQVLFEVNGDKAIGEVLTVLSEIEDKEKVSEFYRPIFFGAGIIPKKLYNKIKHFDITLILKECNKNITKQINKFIGFGRRKYFNNYDSLIKHDMRFMLINNEFDYQNFEAFANLFLVKKRKKELNNIENNNKMIKFRRYLQKLLFDVPSYICFDQDTKMTLETQKQANFVIAKEDIFTCDNYKKNIKSVYIFGEKKY